MIRPLDNSTYCVKSAITHLMLWRKLNDFQGLYSEPQKVLSNGVSIFCGMRIAEFVKVKMRNIRCGIFLRNEV